MTLGAGIGRPAFLCCFSLLSSVTLDKSQPQATFLSPDYTFDFEILWLHCVLNWGLFPEGIYNPVDDTRPNIISQLENQTSAERPFMEEKKLRWPLKNKSDLQRWGTGKQALLILPWDFWLRLLHRLCPAFLHVVIFGRWCFNQWFV